MTFKRLLLGQWVIAMSEFNFVEINQTVQKFKTDLMQVLLNVKVGVNVGEAEEVTSSG